MNGPRVPEALAFDVFGTVVDWRSAAVDAAALDAGLLDDWNRAWRRGRPAWSRRAQRPTRRSCPAAPSRDR
jgi:hypothetical protein